MFGEKLGWDCFRNYLICYYNYGYVVIKSKGAQ